MTRPNNYLLSFVTTVFLALAAVSVLGGQDEALAQRAPKCAAASGCSKGQTAVCKRRGNCMNGSSLLLNGCLRFACEASGPPTPLCKERPICAQGFAECKRMAVCVTGPGSVSSNKRCVEWACKAPPVKMIPSCEAQPTCRPDERPSCQKRGSCIDRTRVSPRVTDGCQRWVCHPHAIPGPQLPKRPTTGPGKGPVLR